MHTEIEKRWKKLEESKRMMEETIAEKTCDVHLQLNDSWSIAQVGYMKKKSSGGWDTLEDAKVEHHEKSAAINARLESDERYKAPDVLPEPGNTTSLEEILTRWNLLRDELYHFILTIDSNYFNKLVFRQPAAGMLTILHALEFMDAHLRHHLPQVKRIQQG
jgi:hypothetical protein